MIESEDNYIDVNGVNINISEIIRACGANKTEAIKMLILQAKVGFIEGKRIIDDAYAKWYVPGPKKGFWEKFAEEAEKQRIKSQEQAALKKKEKREEKDRVKQMDKEGTVYCPKCKSTSLSSNKKGFGIGKAVIGAALTGGIGLIAGNINAKKVRITCLKCGYQFWAGK